jgi:hypothetical protein
MFKVDEGTFSLNFEPGTLNPASGYPRGCLDGLTDWNVWNLWNDLNLHQTISV